MRQHAGEDLLAFLLLRHTGFRGSDAVQLTWAEVRFDTREIERLTQTAPQIGCAAGTHRTIIRTGNRICSAQSSGTRARPF
jgi:integrase